MRKNISFVIGLFSFIQPLIPIPYLNKWEYKAIATLFLLIIALFLYSVDLKQDKNLEIKRLNEKIESLSNKNRTLKIAAAIYDLSKDKKISKDFPEIMSKVLPIMNEEK